MDKNQKLDIILRFEKAIDPLIAFMKEVPAAAVDFRPAMADAWTIREHAVHFLDADTFGHARIRLTVTEPGVELFVWDEAAWQAKARYDTTEPLHALETARTLRGVSAAMARALVDSDWDAYYVHHAVRGRMTLVDVFQVYTDHADFHLAYLRRNLEAFVNGQSKG